MNERDIVDVDTGTIIYIDVIPKLKQLKCGIMNKEIKGLDQADMGEP